MKAEERLSGRNARRRTTSISRVKAEERTFMNLIEFDERNENSKVSY